MRFRLPFDDVQRSAAVRHYAQMRSYLRNLRDRFPPRSGHERDLLKRLREEVQDFGRELAQPHGRINPMRLDALSIAMARTAVDYIAAREAPPTR